MITLNEIFEDLAYGELAQLFVGGEGTGVPTAEYPKIISATNLALTALYSRFPLNEKQLDIQQYENIAIYHLDIKYAQSNADSDEPIKYILDTVERPFLDDVIRITAAFNEVGEEVPLNDENAINSTDGLDNSWFTPSYDSVQIPYPVSTNICSFVYRAKHVKIPLTTTDANLVEVEVPESLREALLTYIGARVYSSRGSESALGLSQVLFAKYESICLEVEQRNLLLNGSSATNIKLEINGWV